LTTRADVLTAEAHPSGPVLDPFGDPDGARADIDDLVREFIDFDGHDGLATRPDDLTARVIVGRKGAGKTVYLRRARAHATRQHDLYADDLQQSLPTTTDIVKASSLYPLSVVTEAWMGLWRAAILRSVVSHLLNNRKFGIGLLTEDEEDLRTRYKAVLGGAHASRTPLSVYSQLTEILVRHRTRGGLDRYLHHRLWEELEYRAAELLRRFPPVCFYIDAVDEEFRHAPMFWLMCQRGLFYQVMRFLRDSRLGGRLHLFICVRDHVYASLFESEHATRYLDPRHIRLLEWDDGTIRQFLHAKLKRLPPEYFAGPGGPSTAAWLGVTEVRNEARDRTERVQDYLVRHTRLLPRDIVVMGNELCREILAARERGQQLRPETIRRVVRVEAGTFGREQLSVAANQIAADLMPGSAAQKDFVELYTGSDPNFTGAQAYQDGLRKKLIEFIETIRDDRFSQARFRRADKRVRAQFEHSSDPMSVLWQNGLLGYVEDGLGEGEAVFYSAADRSSLEVPRGAAEYAFHPCLLDAIRLKGGGPGTPPTTPVRRP
jgi:hypothetical protein